MYRLRTGCCGCTLQTVASIAIYMTLIGSACSLISMIQILLESDVLNSSRFFVNLMYSSVPLCLITIAASVLALMGIQKKKAKLLLPFIWVILQNILVTILWLGILYIEPTDKLWDSMVQDTLNQYPFEETDRQNLYVFLKSMYPVLMVGLVTSSIFTLLMLTYFFLVVYSYYREMSDIAKKTTYTIAVDHNSPLNPPAYSAPSYYPPPPPPYDYQSPDGTLIEAGAPSPKH